MLRRAPSRGFTLLELLVVLMIIGVMTSFAVLSIGNRTLSDRQEVEATRMQQLFILAQDEALFQRVELGFYSAADHFGFLTPDGNGGWTPYETSGPLRPRRYNEPFRAELYVEGSITAPPDEEDPEPSVLILSSGDMTPFRLEIHGPDLAPMAISGDALGRVALDRNPEPE